MNSEHKQTINLSFYAISILHDDMEAFAPSQKFNGFLNDILEMYSESAAASIYTAMEHRRHRIRQALDLDAALLTELTPKQQERIVCLLDKEAEVSFYNVEKSFSRGKSMTFRLNNRNYVRFFTDDKYANPNVAYYDGYYSRYFKAVIEEYCELPRFQREEIYFRDLINTINQAIETDRMIRVEIETPYTVSPNETWDVRPYGILPDASHLYHYLVGKSVRSGGHRRDEKIASIRISRIRKITLLNKKTHRNGALSVSEKKEIQQKIQRGSVSFLVGDEVEIIVRFTEAGKKIYRNALFMRPLLKNIDDNDNYHFVCSRMQAEQYFIRFGENAEILSPDELRLTIAEKFRAAADIYT